MIEAETTTLDRMVLFYGKHSAFPLEINRFLVTRESFDHPVHVQLSRLPMRVGLLLMLYETDVVLDYRYEQLLITTAEDARTWTDRSGVNQLKPPPDSAWAKALNASTGVEFQEISPHWSDELSMNYGVKLHVDDRVPMLPPGASISVTIHDVQRPLREWLHLLLGRENLTCRLEGDTLVVEPLN